MKLDSKLKMKKLLLIGLCIFLTSCSGDDTYAEISGNYTGFFERGERTGEVSLSFNDGIYTGATELQNSRRFAKETTL